MSTRAYACIGLMGTGVWGIHTALVHKVEARLHAVQQRLIPNGNAKRSGCRTGGIRDINRTEPSWVDVDPRDHRTKILEGLVVASHVTHEDFPFNHDSHDHNTYILPDPASRGLMSDANHGATSRDHRPAMEVEWESKHYPLAYWPVPGDQAWVMGRHIFDCGHPPYRTEIHPPVATAYTRAEPHLFAGDAAPSDARKSYIFIGNQGGYYVTKAGGRDYVINVPMPPKPAGPAVTARFEIVQPPPRGMPAPVLTPRTIDGKPMLEVRIPLSNVADPTRTWDLYEWIPRARKAMRALRPGDPRRNVWPKIDRPTNVFAYGTVVASSWRSAPTLPGREKAYRELEVTFDSVKVHHDRDPFKGEWNLYVRANGTWIKVPEKSVNDGDTIRIGRRVSVIVPEDGRLTLFSHGWEDDNDGYFRVGPPPDISKVGATNENEKLPALNLIHTARDNFGVGATRSVRTRPGDYTLNYRVREVRRFGGSRRLRVAPADGGGG